MIKPLGQGFYGRVRLIKAGQLSYAMKTPLVRSSGVKKTFAKEYLCHARLQHPHIIRVDYANEDGMFFEFAGGGTVEEKRQHLQREQVVNVLKQVVEALLYMHGKGYIHRDIKCDNIFLTEALEVKVGDLGVAHAIEDFQEGKKPDFESYHLPPEFFQGTLSKEDVVKIDVWSFGVLIWEFLRKNKEDKLPGQVSARSLSHRLESGKCKKLDPAGQLCALMVACLDEDPKKRPTMEEVAERLAQV